MTSQTSNIFGCTNGESDNVSGWNNRTDFENRQFEGMSVDLFLGGIVEDSDGSWLSECIQSLVVDVDGEQILGLLRVVLL